MVLAGLLALFCLPTSFAQDWQPVPVSEYAEKSGPNTFTFLSYPKYYKDADQKLTLVKTNLVESADSQWDYEVTTGIWTLRVRTDGTFQAEHQGDVFSYQLSGVGVGRGEAFSAFDWGTPTWKNYQIMGDTIRWSDVFPDVDLSVRYIHHILKVDVIVKAALMNQIRGEVQKGNLNAEDYLTVRFDIPSVWVSSEARQAGEKIDLYAESLDVNQPLQFVKDDKVIHKLRPVETYILDEKGEPIITFDEESIIRSAQTWRLKKDAAGVAEMSAHLGDLAKAPEGDVVIDPSEEFDNSDRDTLLVDGSGPYGSSGIVDWGGDDRLLFGFDVSVLPSYSEIDSSSLRFKIYQNRTAADAAFTAYKVTTSWDESTADWDTPWSTDGGDYDSSVSTGNIVIPYDYEGRFENLDISNILNSHLSNSEDDVKKKGVLLKRNSSYDTSNIRIYTNNAIDSDDLPILTVDYTTVHDATFYKHSSVTCSTSLVDDWIDTGNYSIQTKDGLNDPAAAEAEMQWDGAFHTLSSTSLTAIYNLTDKANLYTALSAASGEHKVYVLNQIEFSGKVYSGHAFEIGGQCIAMDKDEPWWAITLIHELGHNVGLEHPLKTSEWESYVMYYQRPMNNDQRFFLRENDKTAYEAKQYCE